EVTGYSRGNTTISATTEDGGFMAQANITITDIKAVTSISLDKSNLDISIGKSADLVANVLPVDATNKTILWSSSNPSVATVDENGKVKGLAKGQALISAITVDSGKLDSAIVNVKSSVESVNIVDDLANIELGASKELTITFVPADADNKNVIWSSSNPNIVSVNQDGKVTALARGEVIVTVETIDGAKKDTITIYVKKAVESVSLNTNNKLMGLDETYQLVETVMPADASDKSVFWTSNNEAIASVSTAGLVTAKIPGIAVISVRTKDGGYSASAIISVRKLVNSISLDASTKTLGIGEKDSLIVSFNPGDASLKDVTWSSSNESIVAVSRQGVISGVSRG
ncbi:MAG: Ig-like domain-containing protein, partial [Anaerovoracaceae bacterium]